MTRRFATSSNAAAVSRSIRQLSAIFVVIVFTAAAVAIIIFPSEAAAFTTTSSSSCHRFVSSNCISLTASAAASNNNELTAAINKAKHQINQAISTTDKGRSTNLSPSQRSRITSQLSHLESLCPPKFEPARSPLMDGPWIVLYTDAPPPSNGQLGPLKGVAKQVIDLKKGTYKNELYVGGSGVDQDQNAWVSAVLEATWKEWDGVYLDANDIDSSNIDSDNDSTIDHGATTWRVDFVSLTLSIFQVPIFTQTFQEGTARTWKMTYLDDDTRIVRAGKTGRGEDDWIFYMRRGGSGGASIV